MGVSGRDQRWSLPPVTRLGRRRTRRPSHAVVSTAGSILQTIAVWLLYFPALFILILYFQAFFDHGWSIVTFPFQIDYGEAPELNRAVLLSQLRQIYVDWS